MKRVFLFLVTNIAIVVMLSIVASVLGINNYVSSQGINFENLILFALLMGFSGSIISLLISKKIAKWTMKLTMIDGTEGPTEKWIYGVVEKFAQEKGINMPEVSIYDSPEMNAFATGPSKNNSLVAVSTGLLRNLNKDEVEAVIGHEVAHVANGDMVTLTLVQGVVNTFVIVASRVVAFTLEKFINREDEESEGQSWVYYVSVIVLDILFGILASMIVSYYSRVREFAADKGGAELKNKQSMINALRKLGQQTPGHLPEAVKSFGISGQTSSFLALFSTHPPIEKRIEALENA